jgi:hypothetical protein
VSLRPPAALALGDQVVDARIVEARIGADV